MGVIIIGLISLNAILGFQCIKLNGELELNKVELDLNYSNINGQVIQRMHAQMWICKDYSALIKDIIEGEKSIEELKQYISIVGNFTNPDIIQGDFKIINKNKKELYEVLTRMMNCINLDSSMLEEMPIAELKNLGEAFNELSMFLKDDKGTILYYLRKDMQGEKLNDIEKDEFKSIIQQIELVLARIEAYD